MIATERVGTALFRVDGVRRNQIDLALRASGDRGQSHLGIAGLAAIIDALEALEALGSVEHAVQHPGVGMIMHAAGAARHAHNGVDHEMVVGIDVEQQILAAFGRGPACGKRLQRRILHELLKQRLGLFHAALVFGILPPRWCAGPR